MSVVGEAFGAIREALELADNVKRTGETLKDLARELREHDRRITRLEAQWDTALALRATGPAGSSGSLRRIEGS